MARQVTEAGNDISPAQLASIAALGKLHALQLSQRSMEDEHLQVGGWTTSSACALLTTT